MTFSVHIERKPDEAESGSSQDSDPDAIRRFWETLDEDATQT